VACKKAQEVNREIAKYVDVMIGNEEDFTASLGFEVKGVDHNISNIELDAFKAMIETAVKEFSNFKVAATTLRGVKTATVNDWSAILWHDGKFHESRKYPDLEILDRVGGGDSASPPACSSVSWSSTTRRRRSNTVPPTALSPRPPRRHLDGHPQGSREDDGRRRRACGALMRWNDGANVRMRNVNFARETRCEAGIRD
jgi:hypothetical protein